ncbi:MAG: hypothetical protein ACRCTA_05480, partial [Bacilli bacterium]
MFLKIGLLKRLFLITIILNSLIALALFLSQSYLVFIVLLVVDLVLVYFYIVDSNNLEQDILNTKNLVSSLINKAIDVKELPILTYDEESNIITWENEYFKKQFGFYVNLDINDIFDGYLKEETKEYLFYNERYYNIVKRQGIILFEDVSIIVNLKKQFDENRECLFFIKLDSIEDLSATIDEIALQE